MAQSWKEEGRKERMRLGEQKGRNLEKLEVARNLLKAGIVAEIISKTTGLSVQEIRRLKI